MEKSLLRQWVGFVALQAFAAQVIYHFGGFHYLLETDKTYITSAIIGLTIICTLAIGYKLRQFYVLRLEPRLTTIWYWSAICTQMGLAGTVIGFIMMLTGIDPDAASDISNLGESIVNMTTSMGTALTTTLVGIVCATLIRTQLVYIEERVDNAKAIEISD